MTDFPDLVLVELFSFFSLKESGRLAAVNRHWRAVLERCTKKRLCVCHPTCQFVELFEHPEVLAIDRKLDYAAIFPPTLKSGLVELSLFQSPITADLQRELSSRPGDFARLKVLRIDGLQPDLQQEFRLALPALHTLCLKGFRQAILLNCPLLERLTIHNSRKQSIVIGSGETIKFLECQFLNDNFRGLANLEHLIALRIEISLLQFGGLRKLEVFPFWQDFDRLTRIAQEWLRSATVQPGEGRPLSSNRSILINGLAYPADGQVNMRLFDLYQARYQGSEKSLLLGSEQSEHISANYPKLVRNQVSVPFKARLNYSSLVGKFSGRIPDSFFSLFPNIQEIQVYQSVDTNDLLTFLRKTKAVRRLAVFECEPEQRLFDGLRSVRSIGELKISERKKRICFDFLSGLQQLSSLSLHHFELPWRTVSRALESNKYFDQFCFEDLPKENSFQVRKLGPDCFEFWAGNEKKDPTSLETIFNLLDQADKWNFSS